MKSGQSFSEKDYQKGNKYVDKIVKKMYDANVKVIKNPRAQSSKDKLNDAKYGDLKIYYNDDNHLNIEVKSSG